jgi:hypothetical protein
LPIPNVILVRCLNAEYALGDMGLCIFSKEFEALVARELDDPDCKFLSVDR